MQTYFSNGKLLLTGEYIVLDGAKALALPTKLGQSLIVEPLEGPKVIWKSLDENGKIWFEEVFLMEQIAASSDSDRFHQNDVSKRLIQILQAAQRLNPNFLTGPLGYRITTKLSFPKDWGLGTSSTLINNIAQWAKVDAYHLLKLTFGGSGYDIACAQYNTAITYQLKNGKPSVDEVDFNPTFKDHLYFVYLNKKQNSREGITHYKNAQPVSKDILQNISALSEAIVSCNTLNAFQDLMQQHEAIISKVTQQTPVKDRLFNDFKGSIKSLGAWGGDFVLAASKDNPRPYFENKGYTTVLDYTVSML